MGSRLKPGTMHLVDLTDPSTTLGMQAWADDRGSVPTVIFTTSHHIETFAAAGGPGPDPHLHGLATSWARLDNFPGWVDPAPGWSAVLNVAADEFTMTGPDDVLFYSGGLGSPR